MPGAQLMSAMLETAINKLLSMDEDTQAKLSRLKGRQLMVSLTELPDNLVFAFSTSVDVLCLKKAPSDTTELLPPKGIDCYLATSVMVLPELKDVSNITHLIKQDKLRIEGDIQLAQQFSHLLKNLDIDWQGQLARHTGDVLAHELFQVADHLKGRLLKFKQRFDLTLRDALLEEKAVSVTSTELESFHSQVQEVQQRTVTLERRLIALLESRQH